MNIVAGNLTSAWVEAVNEVLITGESIGSRDGRCRERIGVTITLLDINQNFVLHPIRKADPVYANAELLWYLSGRCDADLIRAYAPSYERFLDKGIAYGAYGRRISGTGGTTPYHNGFDIKSTHFEMDWSFAYTKQNSSTTPLYGNQLDYILQLLKQKPETRQAVLQLWHDSDLVHALAGDKKDLPCTQSLQFLIRNNKLHCICTMRSNDLWLGTPYDIYCWTSIQRMMADELGVGYGSYVHNVGSLHLYDRICDKANLVWNERIKARFGHDYNPKKIWDDIPQYVAREEYCRTRKLIVDLTGIASASTKNVLVSATTACMTKWAPKSIIPETIDSPLLQKAYSLCHS